MPLVLSFSLILTHLGVVEVRATAVIGESSSSGIYCKGLTITSVIY